MKNALFILIFLFMPVLYVVAQDAAYTKAMESAMAQMEKAKSPQELDATVNSFTRIAEAKPQEWLPAYYKNLVLLRKASQQPGGKEKDQVLEQVLAELELLLQQQPGNSELLTLKGFQHILYLSANPQARGQLWSGKAIQVLEQALAANPENPRANLLMGQMQFGMAQYMKSSTEEACSLFDKSVLLYATENEGKEALMPVWGLDMAQKMQQHCQSAAQQK